MEPSGYQYTTDKRKRYYDYTLLFMVIALMMVGILMIASISPYNAAKYLGNSTFYTYRQIRYVVVGIAGMVAISLVDYRLYAMETPKKKVPLLLAAAYLIIVALEVAVIAVGRTDSELSGATNGAARWLSIGPLKLQPGEFAKLFMIMIAAYAMCKVNTYKGRFKALAVVCVLLGLIGALAAKESMTTGIILFAILGGLIFVCSKKKFVFVILLAIGIFAAVLLVRYVDHNGAVGSFRFRRIYEWRHLTDENNVGQVKQGLYALSSGGLFGKGLGNSVQKLGHIPEVHTDMIFACIVEELGLFGGAALILLFLVLLWRIAIVAINAPDLYGTLLCYGVLIHIGLQVCINIAVVTGTLPSTGVTLPFISYGGSSLLVLCAECGVVLNVSRNIGYRKRVILAEEEPSEEKPKRTFDERPQKTAKKPFGGLRKVKDDHKRKKPEKRGTPSRSKSDRYDKAERDLLEAEAAVRRDETPNLTPGGYRMDVVLGQPSRRDDDRE
ncbi:MAG: cell division protein FtsW [Lachnospiraceae bacterium]|nr:cell division protein FtsW [Lachnospiraceae bacterium]